MPSSSTISSMGSKRNRFLIRQSRIKRDSDNINQTVSLDTIQTPSAIIEYEISGDASHHSAQHFHSGFLSVPPRIERHASEPAPTLISSSPQLLSVPSHSSAPPYLVKQHSHPLLPSQQTVSSSFIAHSSHNSGSYLHRQLSHPLSTVTLTTLGSDPITPSSSITISESLLSGRSGTTAVVSESGGNDDADCTTLGVISTSSLIASTPATITTSGKTPLTVTSTIPPYIKKEQSDNTPPPPITKAHSSGVILMSESLSVSSSILRVKSEELQRSASSPQTLIRELSLENTSRSSHCPVIRPGPALGCNFCWNTIDAHGRILRRKTKYHCPECQTNLCIVPCFQEYHERQSSENPSSSKDNTKFTSTSGLKHHSKTTESI